MTSKIIPPEVLDQLKEAGQRLTIPRAPRDADDVIVLLKAWREYDSPRASSHTSPAARPARSASRPPGPVPPRCSRTGPTSR